RTPVISFSFPMLRIFRIVRSVRLSKTSSRVSKSSLDFILKRRSRSYLSSRFLSFSSTLSDMDSTLVRGDELLSWSVSSASSSRRGLRDCETQVESAQFLMFEYRFGRCLENSCCVSHQIR